MRIQTEKVSLTLAVLLLFPLLLPFISSSAEGNQQAEEVGLHIPNPPRNITGEIGVRYCRCFWEVPLGTDLNPLIGYRIFRGITFNSPLLYDEIGPDRLDYTDNNVTYIAGYYYWISAFNSHGESDKIRTERLFPLLPPTKVNDLTVQYSDHKALLTWEPSSVSSKETVSYTVERAVNDIERFVEIETGMPATHSSLMYYRDPFLMPGNTYHYRVLAISGHGLQNESEIVSIDLSDLPSEVPSQVIELHERVTRSSVTLMWDRPVNDGGSSLIGYIIRKGRSYDPVYEVDRVPLDVETWEDPDPWDDTPAYYSVTPYNIQGEGETNWAYADLTDEKLPEELISCLSILIILIFVPGIIAAAIAHFSDERTKKELTGDKEVENELEREAVSEHPEDK